ncbi:hypothetical protein BJ138DRAFT_1113599 [Hygrophoropsis aurantiaca]|uniref:Uncharacterized protein n=1 Tax=Hygrophoropsis aurantiaca TaxID=72124 RepID=A0ACB8ACZ7_9AGAM|nr:hypothetical protein BJ138DRAFT_1113599 [Hygrophoropsis aurantiaca]
MPACPAPILVARTSSSTTLWTPPTGPWVPKELHAVGSHAPKLRDAWEDTLARELHALLDAMHAQWTSTDVVRIIDADEYYSYYSVAPLILWIGVRPALLSGEGGVVVAASCRALLVDADITDVDVEIRESELPPIPTPSAPAYSYSFSSHPPLHLLHQPNPHLLLQLPAHATPTPAALRLRVLRDAECAPDELRRVVGRRAVEQGEGGGVDVEV